jgi:hypothetical protein
MGEILKSKEACIMMDAANPPRKRGPYKKAV